MELCDCPINSHQTKVDFDRLTSSHGTVTSCMPTSNYYETNVVSKTTYHITTGLGGTKILRSRHFSTAVKLASETAEPTLLGETTLVSPQKRRDVPSSSSLEVVAVVSLVLLQSESDSSLHSDRNAAYTNCTCSWTVSIGPISTAVNGIKPNPQADGLGYNPRCLSRDLSKQAAYSSRDEEITALINGNKDVLSFQNRMQGDFPNQYLGVHTAGHFTIGGDAGSDFFNSPSDPVSNFPKIP